MNLTKKKTKSNCPVGPFLLHIFFLFSLNFQNVPKDNSMRKKILHIIIIITFDVMSIKFLMINNSVII
ncbi:hypothetical protein DERF_014978 [Dermatophagoides farinae]|uniref:Uncharacterized protein n=1 Tax=Dermatophagoides farinae TaxID=6954 RepID=A0A922HKH3_DERFA|nr:hypothetical protein DERF_014978 [Dermatophagoides farinae]